MRPGNDNFIAASCFTDAFDIKRQPLIEVIALALDFARKDRHDGLRAADINDHVRAVKPENHTGYNAARFLSDNPEGYCLFFCFTDALEDNLFGSLGGNPAKTRWGNILSRLWRFWLHRYRD